MATIESVKEEIQKTNEILQNIVIDYFVSLSNLEPLTRFRTVMKDLKGIASHLASMYASWFISSLTSIETQLQKISAPDNDIAAVRPSSDELSEQDLFEHFQKYEARWLSAQTGSDNGHFARLIEFVSEHLLVAVRVPMKMTTDLFDNGLADDRGV